MVYAATHDYIVLTHDLDFGAVLAATQGTKPVSWRIKRIRETRQALDSRGIGVSRVDDQIVGLGHENRSHRQDSGMTLS
jgi:hypothetical protein